MFGVYVSQLLHRIIHQLKKKRFMHECMTCCWGVSKPVSSHWLTLKLTLNCNDKLYVFQFVQIEFLFLPICFCFVVLPWKQGWHMVIMTPVSSSSGPHTFRFWSITHEGMHKFHLNVTEGLFISKYRSRLKRGVIRTVFSELWPFFT